MPFAVKDQWLKTKKFKIRSEAGTARSPVSRPIDRRSLISAVVKRWTVGKSRNFETRKVLPSVAINCSKTQ